MPNSARIFRMVTRPAVTDSTRIVAANIGHALLLARYFLLVPLVVAVLAILQERRRMRRP
jgi:hypothetical protein